MKHQKPNEEWKPVCPVCSIGSDLLPIYDLGEGTAVIRQMGYCGHIIRYPTFVQIKNSKKVKREKP